MKQAINLRLDKQVLLTLERLSSDLHTTKTDIIEQSIRLFSQHKSHKQHQLIQFAGILDDRGAQGMAEAIARDKNTKDFSLGTL